MRHSTLCQETAAGSLDINSIWKIKKYNRFHLCGYRADSRYHHPIRSDPMDTRTDDTNAGGEKCPFPHAARAPANRDWWPNQLDLQRLHANTPLSDPMGEDFDYAREFKSLDLDAVVAD